MGFTKDVCWKESDTEMRHLFFRACRRGDERCAMSLVAQCPRLGRDASDDLAEFGRRGRSGLAEAALAGHFGLAEALHPHSGKWWDATDDTPESVNLAMAFCLDHDLGGLRWLEDFSSRTGIPEIGSSIGAFYRWRSIDSFDVSASDVFRAVRVALDNDPKRIARALSGLPFEHLGKALHASLRASMPYVSEDQGPEHAAGLLSCASALLDMGADPRRGANGIAPILSAIQLGYVIAEYQVVAAIELLLARGADPLAVNAAGEGWAQIALRWELPRSAALLIATAEKASLDRSTPSSPSRGKHLSL